MAIAIHNVSLANMKSPSIIITAEKLGLSMTLHTLRKKKEEPRH